ncbi:MAG: DUF1194 domain-containing protein [Alphaproteobacteria bacterium]|nr:DUF1194 domain-containing protein [Alphaproteobacteria bacterium]
MALSKAAGPLVSVFLAFNFLAGNAAAQSFLEPQKLTLPAPTVGEMEIARTVVSARLAENKVGMPGSHGHKLDKPVGACIVDLWDNSISVTRARKELQRAALVQSLISPEFGAALRYIPHHRIGLHIAFFEHKAYSIFPNNQGWLIVDEESRFDIARMIKEVSYPSPGYTRTDIAVEYALDKLQDCKTDGAEGVNVIDIMTDGKLNFVGCLPNSYDCHQGIPFALAARNEAVKRGVTINVLAMVIEREQDLPEWARRFMMTPAGEEQVSLGLRSVGDTVKPGMLFILPDAEKQNAAEWVSAFKELKTRKLIIEMGLGPDGWNRFAHARGLPQIGLGQTVVEGRIPASGQLALKPQ